MNRVNALTAERVEEQREFMDYILEGNRRVIDCIQAIQKSIKGDETSEYKPLARLDYNTKHKETLDMLKPIAPKRSYDEPTVYQSNALDWIMDDITSLRAYVEKIGEYGICGRKEIDDIVNRIYQLQMKLYEKGSR